MKRPETVDVAAHPVEYPFVDLNGKLLGTAIELGGWLPVDAPMYPVPACHHDP